MLYLYISILACKVFNLQGLASKSPEILIFGMQESLNFKI